MLKCILDLKSQINDKIVNNIVELGELVITFNENIANKLKNFTQ
jgi:hypothetical protein